MVEVLGIEPGKAVIMWTWSALSTTGTHTGQHNKRLSPELTVSARCDRVMQCIGLSIMGFKNPLTQVQYQNSLILSPIKPTTIPLRCLEAFINKPAFHILLVNYGVTADYRPHVHMLDVKYVRNQNGIEVHFSASRLYCDCKGAIHKLRHTNFMIFLPFPRPCHISET